VVWEYARSTASANMAVIFLSIRTPPFRLKLHILNIYYFRSNRYACHLIKHLFMCFFKKCKPTGEIFLSAGAYGVGSFFYYIIVGGCCHVPGASGVGEQPPFFLY